MTVRGKINVFLFSAALLTSCLLAGFFALHQYQIDLDRLVEGSLARVLSRPDLQIDIYQRDEKSLERGLETFLQPPAVSFAIAYDSLGTVLAVNSPNQTAIGDLPAFGTLRVNLSAVEPGKTALGPGRQNTGTGLWSSLRAKEYPIHLTIPVFSSVNPTAKGLERQDFYAAMSTLSSKQSLVVIGYVHLGIDRKKLLDGIYPSVSRVFLGSLAILVLCALIVMRLTRHITVPLSQLGKLADDLASGELTQQVEINGSKEFRDIAFVLNRAIGSVSNFRRENDAGHHLLNLKLDERASQLSLRDEELNKAAEEITQTRNQLHQVSYYDNLTNLPNRRLFTEQLNLLLRMNQRTGKPLAVLFLNLDNFKRINDSLGHSAGDLLLQEVGRRLTGCLRDSDILTHHSDSEPKIEVSRLGGDEFSVVLNHLDNIESAGVVAQRVIDTLRVPITIDGHELVVSPSIGISIAPRNADTVEGMLKAAGVAMFHAKVSTKDDFLYYHADLDAAGPEHLRLESDLRRAIERDELVLHYQPQVDTADGSMVGAEALLRWEHPDYGQVPPFKFIAIAEEIGLIAQLGDWVLVETCRQLKEFREQGLELPRIAINISQFQFNSGFVERVREVLQEVELPPSMLELGLTESLLMDEHKATARALEEFRDMGVHLTVDDFGTSYAPLGYLSRYSLDELRIDKSFVTDCDKRQDSASLVTAIIAMAGSLGLRMVAEGVESETQYQFLKDNGARVMQGYLFSKPVPASELREMLVVPWHFMEQIQRMEMMITANRADPLETKIRSLSR